MEHVFEMDPAVAQDVGKDHGAELAGKLGEKGGFELLVDLPHLLCWAVRLMLIIPDLVRQIRHGDLEEACSETQRGSSRLLV